MKMKWHALLLTIALAASGPALAQKIHIDYDPDFDNSKVATFTFFFTPETSLMEDAPFLHSRIVNGIEHYLTGTGLTQKDEPADLRVTYHVSATKELRFDTTSYDYGYPRGWYRDPYWGRAQSVTTVSRYARGTLVVDVWDTATSKLIWRGTAQGVAPDTSRGIDKKVDAALRKMVKKWQKIRAKSQ